MEMSSETQEWIVILVTLTVCLFVIILTICCIAMCEIICCPTVEGQIHGEGIVSPLLPSSARYREPGGLVVNIPPPSQDWSHLPTYDEALMM